MRLWGPERVLKIVLAFFCLFFIFSACYCHFFAFCCVFFSLYKIVLECKQIVLFPSRQSPLSTHHLYNVGSLRSKRFQSSYCAKVRAGAKNKKVEEGGGGEKRKRRGSFFPLPLPLPLPRHSFFFALVPTFSTNSRGNACYAGYSVGSFSHGTSCDSV